MKKEYISPDAEIIRFDTDPIMLQDEDKYVDTSTMTVGGVDNPGSWDNAG